jgi:serine/threonine protein phosphatase 1
MAGGKKHSRDGRLFAIGDIHGCADELTAMLEKIAPCAGDTVVFVGDYIDRGPSSREVIDYLIEFERGPAAAVFLKGNHEDMLLNFMGYPGHYGESFEINGGAQTLESYGMAGREPAEVSALMPERHIEFLRNLQHCYRRPPYLFVHAGILPGRTLEEQSAEDMLWIRHDFIFHPHSLDSTVVFGHTPMRTVMLDLPFKLGIDTGLVYGGKLSCVELTEGVAYQIGRGSRQVKRSALDLG